MNQRNELGGSVHCAGCGATEWHRRDPALSAVQNGWLCTGDRARVLLERFGASEGRSSCRSL